MMFINLCNIFDTHPIFQDPLKYFLLIYQLRSNSEINEGLRYLTCMQFSYSKAKLKNKHLCSNKKRSDQSDNTLNFMLTFLVWMNKM